MSSNSTMKANRESYRPVLTEQNSKRQRNTEATHTTLPYRYQSETASPPQSAQIKQITSNMSDGSTSKCSSRHKVFTNRESENEARVLRVLEIMNDFRTLQQHITAQVTRAEASPPDQAAYYLDGYVILRQANADAQAILATSYNPGSLGFEGTGRVPDTEVQKANLQRIILDASTRRFQAHKIYLKAAAAMRWVLARRQIEASGRPAAQRQQATQVISQRLQQELSNITDGSVANDLRAADVRKQYWVQEDPSLDRMLAWGRR